MVKGLQTTQNQPKNSYHEPAYYNQILQFTYGFLLRLSFWRFIDLVVKKNAYKP